MIFLLLFRLIDFPAIIADHESAAHRRMMKYVDPSRAPPLGKQQLQINPNHPLIIKLYNMRNANPEKAKLVTEQVFILKIFII